MPRDREARPDETLGPADGSTAAGETEPHRPTDADRVTGSGDRVAETDGTTDAGDRGTDADDGPVLPETPAPSFAARVGHWLREFAVVVVLALVVTALLRAFVVQAFYVPSGSMEPAINVDDRILVSKLSDPERGAVVVFQDPGGWIPPEMADPPPTGPRRWLEWLGVLPTSAHGHLVKRVVGMPGDRVRCCDDAGRLVVNGVPVDETSLLAQDAGAADDQRYDVVVPEGHLFVLGDHRYGSGDSAAYLEGQPFVPMDLVVGRAVATIWPLDGMGGIGVPDVYAGVPEPETVPSRGRVRIGGGAR